MRKLGILQHRLEFLARGVLVAFRDARLRIEKLDHRLGRHVQQAGGLFQHTPRRLAVARARRDDAGRQRLIAAVAPPRPEEALHAIAAR
jgi:hypothetical protein